MAVKVPEVGSSFAFAGSEKLDLDGAAGVVVVVRDIVYEGEPLHLALLVLDKDWRLVSGTESGLAAGIDAAVAEAGELSRPESTMRVLDEAVGFNDSRNTDPEASTEGFERWARWESNPRPSD